MKKNEPQQQSIGQLNIWQRVLITLKMSMLSSRERRFKKSLVLALLLPSFVCAQSFEETIKQNEYINFSCTYSSLESSVSIDRKTPVLSKNEPPGVVIFKAEDIGKQYMTRVEVDNVAECVYPSGDRVRLKVGSGVVHPDGPCGSVSPIFLSLWVNQRKVESRVWFAGHCRQDGDEISYKISSFYGAPIISKCRTITAFPEQVNSLDGPAQPVVAESCLMFPDVSRYPIDDIEYQNGVALKFQKGTYKIVSGSDPVCQHIANGYPTNLEYLPFSTTTSAVHEMVEKPMESVLDIDGDGNIDRVVKLDFSIGYTPSGALLIQPGTSNTDFKSKEELLSSSSWLLPCQLDKSAPGILECPPFSKKNYDAGLRMGVEGGSPVFTILYGQQYLLRFQNHIYILLTTGITDADGYLAVIKLIQDGNYEKTCLIQEVRENF